MTINTDAQVSIEFYQEGKSIGVSTFTMEDAKAAKLNAKDNWQKFPRNMLFARAISNGVRWYCPDVFSGAAVYTPDEIGVDAEVVEVAPTPKRQPQPEDSISMDTVEEIQFGDGFGDEPKQETPQATANERPATPETVKGWIVRKAVGYVNKAASQAQRGLVAGVLEKCFAGSTDSKQDRHFVQEYLTGHGSLGDAPDSYVLSLLDWLKPVKVDGGAYIADGNAVIEAGMIRNTAMEAAGQTRLI